MTKHPEHRGRRRQGERGSILIQVAVASVVLIAFSMYVVDYGMMLVGRRQAQNAADGAALAGAIAMAFDADDRSPNGPAKMAAYNVSQVHGVIGEAPNVIDPSGGDATDIMFYGEAPAKFPPECADDSCIRVDVYRNQQRGNALPSWFGALLGVSDQGVKATATAQAGIGDTTNCLKPWAVLDKWTENWEDGKAATEPWSQTSDYDKYYTKGPDKGNPDPSITNPDVYVAPTTTSTGTGLYPFNPDGTPSPWYGLQYTLKTGSLQGDFDPTSGWFLALALSDSKGGKDYKNNIKGCIGLDYTIGQELPIDTEPGNKVGPTRQAVVDDDDSLVNQDPSAYWDTSLNGGAGGVAGSMFSVSPRIVPVPLVNPDLMAEVMKGGRDSVPISNIMGFFIEGLTADKKGVVGRLCAIPGMKASGASAISEESAFLKVIQLVR